MANVKPQRSEKLDLQYTSEMHSCIADSLNFVGIYTVDLFSDRIL